MIKNFNELSKVDVKITEKPVFKWNAAKQKTEEVKGQHINTFAWVDCLKALYENGAEEVIYESIPNENGGLLYHDENGCIHIKVFVEIDGKRREIFYPVIDGTKDISLAKVTQSDIYNAKQRAFVKCVATNWGLGIKVWEKEEEDPDKVSKAEEKISVYEYFRNLVNTASKHCGGVPEMLKHLAGVNEKQIKTLIEQAKVIDGIQATLEKVLENDKKPE